MLVPTLFVAAALAADLPPELAAPPAEPPRSGPVLDPGLLTEVKTRHLRLQKSSMAVLMGWSVANLEAGAVGWWLGDKPRTEAFWLGSAAFNTVNLAISASSLATLPTRRREPATWDGVRRQTDSLERALLFNVGLDFAWLAAGLWLHERGDRLPRADYRGYGDALLLQGGFLLAFDTTLLVLSNRISKPLRRP